MGERKAKQWPSIYTHEPHDDKVSTFYSRVRTSGVCHLRNDPKLVMEKQSFVLRLNGTASDWTGFSLSRIVNLWFMGCRSPGLLPLRRFNKRWINIWIHLESKTWDILSDILHNNPHMASRQRGSSLDDVNLSSVPRPSSHYTTLFMGVTIKVHCNHYRTE